MDEPLSFDFVNTRIATGGEIKGLPARIEQLVQAGITHVINCTEFDDTPSLAPYGIECLWASVEDDGQPKSVEWFQKMIEWSFAAFQYPGTKLYFHCIAGSNRGPSACYAFIRALGFAPNVAFQMVRGARDCGLLYVPDADRAITALGY